MDAFTIPAPADLRHSDVLALANTYLNLQADLDQLIDRRSDYLLDYDPSGTDAEFRAYLTACAEMNAGIQQAAALASGAYDALCAIVGVAPHGVWTYSGPVDGLIVKVRFEPVTNMVTAWRGEA